MRKPMKKLFALVLSLSFAVSGSLVFERAALAEDSGTEEDAGEDAGESDASSEDAASEEDAGEDAGETEEETGPVVQGESGNQCAASPMTSGAPLYAAVSVATLG